MSQRSEKLRRQVDILKERMDFADSRVAALELSFTALGAKLDRWAAAEAAVHNQAVLAAAAERNAERRRAWKAEREAKTWKLNAYLTLLLLVLATAIFLAVNAKADNQAKPEPATVPQTVQIIPEALEEPENERIEAALLARAHVIEDVTVTHYDCCVGCCGKDDGITASGVHATPGVTVAVDPTVIPLGSDVMVDYGDGEIHYYRADDTGGAVKGNHIDLCVDTHEEALQLGRRTATVFWVAAE